MNLIEKYDYDMSEKLMNFEKYVPRQALSRFIVRYELFKLIKDTHGSIIECGVHWGGGLMAWAKLCAGFDIFTQNRKVIGFDTFEGFPGLSEEDLRSRKHSDLKENGLSTIPTIKDEIIDCIEEFDNNRFFNQFPKVEIVAGDANKTIPQYIKDNEHLLISLLFLDFDLYEPTKVALEHFMPRMHKGSVLAFDNLQAEAYKGETIAALEYFGNFNKLNFRKFPFDTRVTYAIIE